MVSNPQFRDEICENKKKRPPFHAEIKLLAQTISWNNMSPSPETTARAPCTKALQNVHPKKNRCFGLPVSAMINSIKKSNNHCAHMNNDNKLQSRTRFK